MANNVEIKFKIEGVEYSVDQLQELAKSANQTATATENMTEANEEASKQNKKTAEEFVKLERRIEETREALQRAAEAGDDLQFQKLKGELDELNESLEKTKLQSAQFDDQLAQLPGPAGAVGQAMQSLDGLFKLLAANPVVAVIAGLGALFLTLYQSMKSTAEGQAVLNRITEAFGKILGPVMLLIQKVALPVFEGLALVIEKVAGAFTFFAEKLGFSEKQIAEASKGVEKVQEETAAREEKLKKSIEERMLAEQEATKKAQEDAKKRAELAKQRQQNAREVEKTLEQLRVQSIKDEALRLTEEVRLQKEAAMEQLKAKGATAEQLAQLEAYYNELSLTKQQEYNQKKADEQKAADEKAQAEAQAAAEKQQAIQDEATQILTRVQDAKLETDGQRQIAELDRQQAIELQKLQIAGASEEQLTETREYYANLRKQIIQSEEDAQLAAASRILGDIATLAGEGTNLAKVAGIAQATINTYLAASQALADPTIPAFLKPIAVAATIGLGLKQVKEIAATEPPKAANGGLIVGPSHMTGGVPIEAEGGEFIINKAAMQVPGVAQMAMALNSTARPSFQDGGSVAGIDTSINRLLSTPIKTYVVATDMTNAQEANANIERIARL